MKWENFVIFENERFVRVKLDPSLNLGDLYSMTIDFDCCFFVFIVDGLETRYRLPNFDDINDFMVWVDKSKASLVSYGIDSDSFDVSKASYLDLYFRYPNK